MYVVGYILSALFFLLSTFALVVLNVNSAKNCYRVNVEKETVVSLRSPVHRNATDICILSLSCTV